MIGIFVFPESNIQAHKIFKSTLVASFFIKMGE